MLNADILKGRSKAHADKTRRRDVEKYVGYFYGHPKCLFISNESINKIYWEKDKLSDTNANKVYSDSGV